jgi:hypothetical protein
VQTYPLEAIHWQMTNSASMFLRPHQRSKDGKDHIYWSLVETVRTANGPRQRTLCYLGELNGSAQARWLKSVEVFNEQGQAQQLKLFPSHIEAPDDDPQVARVLVNRVRLERTRQFGACFLSWELWKHLELDRFFEQAVPALAFGAWKNRRSPLRLRMASTLLCCPSEPRPISHFHSRTYSMITSVTRLLRYWITAGRGFESWLVNCYFACRRACNIVALCPRLSAELSWWSLILKALALDRLGTGRIVGNPYQIALRQSCPSTRSDYSLARAGPS